MCNKIFQKLAIQYLFGARRPKWKKHQNSGHFGGEPEFSPIFLNLPFRRNMSHSASFRKAVCMVHNCSKEPKSSRVVPALKHTAGTKAEAESSFQCRLRFAGSSVYLHQLPFEYMHYSTTLYNTTTYKKHFKKMLGELLLLLVLLIY